MPWIMQMAGCALSLLALAFLVWVGFWVFLALLTLGIILASWQYIRRFLVEKGILNPVPGVPGGIIIEEKTITIIEGDYKRVDDTSKGE